MVPIDWYPQAPVIVLCDGKSNNVWPNRIAQPRRNTPVSKNNICINHVDLNTNRHPFNGCYFRKLMLRWLGCTISTKRWTWIKYILGTVHNNIPTSSLSLEYPGWCFYQMKNTIKVYIHYLNDALGEKKLEVGTIFEYTDSFMVTNW